METSGSDGGWPRRGVRGLWMSDGEWRGRSGWGGTLFPPAQMASNQNR